MIERGRTPPPNFPPPSVLFLLLLILLPCYIPTIATMIAYPNSDAGTGDFVSVVFVVINKLLLVCIQTDSCCKYITSSDEGEQSLHKIRTGEKIHE